MNKDTYVECLVSRKTSGLLNFLRILLIMLAIAFFLLGFITNIGLIALILGVLFAVLAYMVYLRSDIEYEYLYLDREITIDRISAKSKRKRIASFEVEHMEILAPIKSYHLDNYKNRTVKTTSDYSSGVEKQPDCRFVMYYEGDQKIILEPNEDFVKAVSNVAPRKVFKD